MSFLSCLHAVILSKAKDDNVSLHGKESLDDKASRRITVTNRMARGLFLCGLIQDSLSVLLLTLGEKKYYKRIEIFRKLWVKY